jgi:threonine dehydrogenase-like Zn-dependent dehydrogenase
VGAPHGSDVPFETNFWRGIGWQGGVAAARAYIPDLLADVLSGTINPGLVFDYETDLEGIPDAYAAMDERRAITSVVRVGSI